METLPCLPVDIIVGGFNIGCLKNRQESDSRTENLSGHVNRGYHKPGKRYNKWKKYLLQYDAKIRIILMRSLHPDTRIYQFQFSLLPKWQLKKMLKNYTSCATLSYTRVI
jgi:hypothetical protein